MKGTTEDGKDVDNTSDKYVLPWLEVVKQINPRQVMIYTIDRETPDQKLKKATKEELDRIARLVEEAGIKASAYVLKKQQRVRTHKEIRTRCNFFNMTYSGLFFYLGVIAFIRAPFRFIGLRFA